MAIRSFVYPPKSKMITKFPRKLLFRIASYCVMEARNRLQNISPMNIRLFCQEFYI